MADAGFWVAWGLPTQGRERQALDLLNETRGYLARLAQDGQIERFDIAILKPQTTELGGFILIQGTQEQIDSLRHDDDFQVWVSRVQLVADRVGIVDAWRKSTGLIEPLPCGNGLNEPPSTIALGSPALIAGYAAFSSSVYAAGSGPVRDRSPHPTIESPNSHRH